MPLPDGTTRKIPLDTGYDIAIYGYMYAYIRIRLYDRRRVVKKQVSVPDRNTDPLTGALQGNGFLVALEEAAQVADKEQKGFSLVLFDIDLFGAFNKAHGPEIGDEVLKALGGHLRDGAAGRGTVYRGAKQGLVYRNGEEFMVLMPGVEKEEAFLWAEGVRRGFGEPRQLAAAGKKVSATITLSGSVVAYPADAARPQELWRKAFDALHRAKESGRNKVCLSREEKMVTKTSHYTPGQLARLSVLACRGGAGEADLLREALDDFLMKHGV